MSRTEKMVTRTVTTKKLTVMVANLTAKTFTEKEVEIPELVPAKKYEMYINEKVLTPDEKLMLIVKEELHEELYAMSEQDFIKYAHKINKR